MTDFTGHRSQRRDIQDAVERGVWGAREDVAGAGSIMSVRGTGTVDLELPVVNFGYSFNLPADSDAEVIMLSLGSDVNDKVALPTIPRDLQYQWPEGTGGVQHPTDPDRRIEFNDTDTHLTDGVFTAGPNKEVTITIAGGNVTIASSGELDIVSTGDMTLTAPNVEITSGTLTNNGQNVGDSHTHTDTAGLGAGVTSPPN